MTGKGGSKVNTDLHEYQWHGVFRPQWVETIHSLGVYGISLKVQIRQTSTFSLL